MTKEKQLEWLFCKMKELCEIIPVATEWTPNHLNSSGNKYIKDTLVWYDGNIYKCLVDNSGSNITNTYFWEKVGPGWKLDQEQSDWLATSGPSFIKNKPAGMGGVELDPVFEAWLATNPLASFLTTEEDPIFLSWLAGNPFSSYLTIANASTTYYPLSNPNGYLNQIQTDSLYYPLGNPSGYLTSYTETDPIFTTWLATNPFAAYLTVLAAASTYYPLVGNPSNFITLADIPTPDAVPTDGSSNTVASNGVFDALETKQNLVDNFTMHQFPNTIYASLTSYTVTVTNTAFSSTAANSNNQTRFVPFVLDKEIAFDSFYIFQTSANAGAGAYMTMYIYDDSNDGLPGVILHQESLAAGAINTVNTVHTFSSNITLQPGMYWMAFHLRDLDTGGINPTFYFTQNTNNITIDTSVPSYGNNVYNYIRVAATVGDLGDNPVLSITSTSLPQTMFVKYKIQ